MEVRGQVISCEMIPFASCCASHDRIVRRGYQRLSWSVPAPTGKEEAGEEEEEEVESPILNRVNFVTLSESVDGPLNYDPGASIGESFTFNNTVRVKEENVKEGERELCCPASEEEGQSDDSKDFDPPAAAEVKPEPLPLFSCDLCPFSTRVEIMLKVHIRIQHKPRGVSESDTGNKEEFRPWSESLQGGMAPPEYKFSQQPGEAVLHLNPEEVKREQRPQGFARITRSEESNFGCPACGRHFFCSPFLQLHAYLLHERGLDKKWGKDRIPRKRGRSPKRERDDPSPDFDDLRGGASIKTEPCSSRSPLPKRVKTETDPTETARETPIKVSFKEETPEEAPMPQEALPIKPRKPPRKQHECEICDFKSGNKAQLKAHMKAHEEEKCPCEFCEDAQVPTSKKRSVSGARKRSWVNKKTKAS